MKISVITCLDNKNYGNRLQNYAVTKILAELGNEISNIYLWDIEENITEKKSIKKLIERFIPLYVTYFIRRFRTYRMMNIGRFVRVCRFCWFTHKYCPVTLKMFRGYDKLCEYAGKINNDYYVVGSDQVWNPYFCGTPYYFLTFAESKKRIAFAASIGIDDIPHLSRDNYKEWLNNMTYISVRENSAKKIIKDLTGKEVDCIYDPTLLLSRSEWLNIVNKPKHMVKTRYVLSFFLGIEASRCVEEYAKTHRLEVVSMNNKSNFRYNILDPSEFIYMIKHAEVIFTDSFHATAFSIKFRKQFYVFKRKGFENMFSRIDNLLMEFNMTDRVLGYNSKVNIKSSISVDKFNRADKKMKKERKKIENILMRVMKK